MNIVINVAESKEVYNLHKISPTQGIQTAAY